MCILIACEGGTTPPEAHLQRACKSNPDGFGWAMIRPDGKLAMARSLDAESMVATFLKARGAFPDGPAIFHARIASVGRVSLANTHPFPIGDNYDVVVAHNGVELDLGADSPAFDDERSDTRMFAEVFLPDIGLESLDEDFAAWEDWAWPNKLAILSSDPALSKSLYIIGEKSGHHLDGVWYSNHSYLPYLTYGKGISQWGGHGWTFDGKTGTWEQDDIEDIDYEKQDFGRPLFDGDGEIEGWCRLCKFALTSNDYTMGECFCCGACLECDSPASECECEPDAWRDPDRFNAKVKQLSEAADDWQGALAPRMRSAVETFSGMPV